ncbi:HTH-type transcriptional regulator MhqR [Streptococcus constellatus]|uniref:HTH-type transcriptional regulator MhqR n=1 Tax=Streptococcus constellatus TaxID=76860 RepID=A0A564T749_STRCV|nr:MarR family transcriptional regulator [Streptococcus constellatus]VUX03250.1 HTH-type transcriptional regulator MhqR [Streptococcus constellatus]VUX13786.1 HTH-type transcriptional regulator MhqR [Streptococcus gordonii]
MDKLTNLLQENRLDLKTMSVLNKAIRTIRHFESQAAKQHNLTPTQFSVLETLYSKGNLRIQDLIDKMLATSGNMTVVIKNMIRNGWIFRTCDPSDRRSFLVGLTPEGRSKIETVLPEHIQNIQQGLRILTEQDKEDLIRILKKFKNLS